MDRTVVVEGANVVFAERSSTGEPEVPTIVATRRALTARGYALIIIDAMLRHEVDDPGQLEG